MQVSVENVQGLERRMKVCVPVEVVGKVVEECFQKAAKTIKIDGFRPGKVPRNLLEERYGESIRYHEAAPKLIQDTLWEAFKEAKIEPVGRPMLEGNIELKPNEALNYSVLFDVLPEFEVKDLQGVEVEQITSEVTEADVDKAIEQLRQEHAKWVDITTPAEANDKMTLSYTVDINGEEVELEKAENLSVQLGTNTKLLISELQEKLIGLSAGDEKEIQATFPQDYPAESVAGKNAKFAVKIHQVQRAELPELNEDFIKQFDGATSLEEFRKNIKSSMVYYVKTALENINKLNLFDALTSANPTEVPKSMIRAQVESMGKGFLQSIFRQKEISEQELEKHLPFLMQFYKKPAKKRVHLSLVIEEFLKKNPQTITDDMVNKMAEERSALYQDPKAWMEEFLSNPAHKEQFRGILLELALADKLRETAKVNSVSLDYFAVLEKEKSLQNRDFEGADLNDDEESGESGHVHGEHCHHDHEHVHGENCQHEHEHHHGEIKDHDKQ